MTLWSLTSRSVAYVLHPKACDVSFTPDGSFLAVVERKVRTLSRLSLLPPLTPVLGPRTASIICPSSATPRVGLWRSARSCPRATAAGAVGRPMAQWLRCGTAC